GHVHELAERLLGDLPRGDYTPAPLPPLQPTKPAVVIAEQKLPTNYIESTFAGPGWRDPASFAARVAMRLLHEREFKEVRTKRNLSAAPAAFFDNSMWITRGALYVTAVDPNATMKVMIDELHALRDQPVPEKELTSTKSLLLTSYFMRGESTDGLAELLAIWEVEGGDWRGFVQFPERIRAVTAAD